MRRLFVAKIACVLGVMEEIPAMVQDLDVLPEGAKRDMHWRQPHAGKCRYLRKGERLALPARVQRRRLG